MRRGKSEAEPSQWEWKGQETSPAPRWSRVRTWRRFYFAEVEKSSRAVGFFRLDPAFPSSYGILLSNTRQLHAQVESTWQGKHPQPSQPLSDSRWLLWYKEITSGTSGQMKWAMRNVNKHFCAAFSTGNNPEKHSRQSQGWESCGAVGTLKTGHWEGAAGDAT